MADGWDPERLGEPGQRPAPRLSLPSLLLLFSPSASFLSITQLGLCFRAGSTLLFCVWQREQARLGLGGSVRWGPETPLIREIARKLLFDMGFVLLFSLSLLFRVPEEKKKESLASTERHSLWCSQQIPHSLFEWAINIFPISALIANIWANTPSHKVIYGGEIMINSWESRRIVKLCPIRNA